MTTSELPVVQVAPDEQVYKAENPNHPRLVLKHGSVFMIADDQGFFPVGQRLGYGLYRDDTRWLNRWDVTLNGKRMFFLNGCVDEGYAGVFEFSNPRMTAFRATVPEQSLIVRRDVVITDGMTDRIEVKNFHKEAVDVEIAISFDSDFADMFEVRGETRKARGWMHPCQTSFDRRQVMLGYKGLDHIERKTFINFLSLVPDEIIGKTALFRFRLERHETRVIETKVMAYASNRDKLTALGDTSFTIERGIADARWNGWRQRVATIVTENDEFNDVVNRALSDMYILRQETPFGPCLAAGVPWFAVPFGRDDCIAALQTVPVMPDLSREVILFLAHWQGKKTDLVTDERKGKIMHELRVGEMANMHEIAFRPYYGTVDATQLWLMLISEYVKWTGDLDLVRGIWKNIQLALDFLASETSDRYLRYGGSGALTNRGWKDSGNSIIYSDGEQAVGPIALCEPQGYLYSAWTGIATLADAIGKKRVATGLRKRAELLKANFNVDFWMAEKGFIALALDGKGRQCDVISSNPGHLLMTGILDHDKAVKVAQRMMQPDMFCGWGIYTLASSEVGFQPMDYQLGSVWPHDNGIAIVGMCGIGQSSSAHKVMRGLFDVARRQHDRRLPELFCGFEKTGSRGPTRYPVACVPQAWAAGAVFHMLAGCFNIIPDALNNRLRIVNPSVPAWLGTIEVTGLRLGKSTFDITLEPNKDGYTAVQVRRTSGDAEWSVEG